LRRIRAEHVGLWYYRVLQQGIVTDGDRLNLVDRIRPEWPLKRLINLLYVRTLEIDALKELGEVPELTESWRALVELRLKYMRVEDWKTRLEYHGEE